MNTTYADEQNKIDREITPEENEKYYEVIQEMTLMNDELMRMVFPDKRVIELVLSVILKKKLQVISCSVQHEVKGAEGRAVAFDIFAVDEDGKRYNIEVQNASEGASPKRARLNCAYLDSSALKKGQLAKEFRKVMLFL